MGCPAALPAVTLGIGIIAGIFLPVTVPAFLLIAVRWAAVLVWIIALAAFAARRDLGTTASLTFGFALCGAILGVSAHNASRSIPLYALFHERLPPGQHHIFGIIDGRLRADALKGPSGVTIPVEIHAVQLDGIRYATSGGALIGVGGALGSDQFSQWRAGRHVRFPATLRRASRYLNPGVPDAEQQLAWRGTALVGSVKSERLVEIVARGDRLDEAAAAARAAVRRAISTTVAPWSTRSAAVAAAILIGDRAGLDDDLEGTLQEAGTYHVIAISGGNIAILAGLLVLMLRGLRIGPRASAVVVVVALCAYARGVEGGSSVSRATLMAAIYFAAQIWDQQLRPANVAALAAAVVLCVQPLQIVDAGFALTFGATVGIIIGFSRLPALQGLPRWVQPGAALLAGSVCAEVALLPITAFVFSRVTFAGLLVNFAAIPLMTIVQLAGMLAVAFASVMPHIAAWCGWVAHWAVEGLLGSAALVDVAPWLTRRLAPPSVWTVGAYYLTLVAALATRRTPFALATIACAVWIVLAPAAMLSADQEPLRVTFLDVGQGDSAIVQFPNGRTLSIDAGGLPAGGFDIGARVVSPAYWATGVRRLDYMSISHGDEDHIGGAASVLRDFRPLELWEGVAVPPHKPTQRLRALAMAHGTAWRTLHPDDRLIVGDVEVIVKHPPRPDWERQRVRNNDSTVIEVRYRDVSFVFTGDIDREVERSIAAAFERSAIRILKVPHHGSATSSSDPFLDGLRPDVAVISAGRGNTFGHPVASVLARYRAIGAAMYRTDQDGAVTVETDGTTVRVRTFTNRKLTLRAYGR